MIVLALLSSIAAAGVALTLLFIAHGRPDDDRGGPRADMVRYFGMAAIAALLCGAMNVLETAGGGTAAAAGGNAANLLAVGFMWAGARRLNGRRAVGAVSTIAGGILLLALTFVIPLDDATVIKTATLAAFGALGAYEFARRPLGDLGGARLLAWTLGAYAAYNVARLGVVATLGRTWLTGHGPVSPEMTAAVSSVAIAVVSIGAIRVGRQLDDDPAPGTRAHDRGALRREARRLIGSRVGVRVTLARIPEIDLIRTAHSAELGQEMVRTAAAAFDDALAEVVTGVPARDTVFAVAPAATDTALVEEAVRSAFARRMPTISYDDVPDLLFEHHLIRNVDDLSLLMESRRLRPREGLPGIG